MKTENKKKIRSKNSKMEKRVEKDLLKIIGFFAVLVAIFLAANYIFKSMSQIEYQGLVFTEQKYGEITFYNYYYYFEAPDKELIKYNLYLRNDPRFNNASVGEGEVNFPIDKAVYITMDSSELKVCDKSVVSIATLTDFLSNNKLKVKAGTNDYNEYILYKTPYITCENTPNNPVISLQRENRTEIRIDGNCYSIDVGDECNMLEAIEKFEVKAILDARNRKFG